MTNTFFDKTAKGREEIATRAHRLAPRLRTLLLLVDGKRDTVDLMSKVSGLGLDEKALVELLEGEFIEVGGGAAMAAATAASASETPAGEQISGQSDASASNASTGAESAEPASGVGAGTGIKERGPAPPGAQRNTDGILREGETQIQALYGFFSETIRSAIGLRGYAMQLRVERAGSVADFKALRDPYLAAVHKAKGPQLELSLRNRLDQLLSLGD